MKRLVLIGLLFTVSNAHAGVAVVEGCNLNDGYTIEDVVEHSELMNQIRMRLVTKKKGLEQ